MKKLIITIAAAVFAAGSMNAQDLAQATDLYNTGATYLSNGSLENALESFQQAYDMAAALGEEGAEVAENCKNIIPETSLNLAKSLGQDKKYDEAVARLGTTVELAGEYGNQSVADEAKALIPQLLMLKGTDLLNSKDFAGAAAAYKQILDAAQVSLASQQSSYAASQLKYEQGTISKNTLLSAEDELHAAEDAVQNAAIDLFTAYNTYCWAVQHGILN